MQDVDLSLIKMEVSYVRVDCYEVNVGHSSIMSFDIGSSPSDVNKTNRFTSAAK